MSGFDKTIPSIVAEYEIYNATSGEELIKAASATIDLPEDFVFDPDYLYLWVRIVSAGEYYGPNKNGDYFPEAELLKYHNTFKTAHAFKNHENKKVENAIGEILSVRWNPVMKCVEIFKGLDKKRAPEIVRGFIKGYLTDVSMGCKVPYTNCSICGNKARKKSEFCDHVNRYRMQYLGNGERVFEVNYEPHFHDSSAVLTGAERVAKALVIIDTPPAGAKVSFQKVASDRSGVSRYVKLTETEMQKVASYQSGIHPMLMAPEAKPLLKVASHDFLQKMAELEKDVTGRLLNIVTAPDGEKQEAASQMIEIIKFLTEKRFDDTTISTIGQTLKNLADSEGLKPQRVFSIFLGIAEVLGIELYPTELHGILQEMTDAGLNGELNVSEGNHNELYPTEYAQGVKRTLAATEQLPGFARPSSLFDLYDEGAHQTDLLRRDPLNFVQAVADADADDMDEDAPMKVIKVIRQTLTPMMSMRSNQPEFILPRLATVLSGFHPAIGGDAARRDFDILANPQTLGDMLATFAYKNYQHMRPAILHTRMIRLAMNNDRELEKVANFWDPSSFPDHSGPQGIKRRYLLMFGVPAIYAASAFQKNRRKHGRNLSDGENFAADHPGIISSGIMLGGKPLSRAVARGGVQAIQGAKKVKDKIVTALEKTSSAVEFAEIVKLADSFSSGQYSAFGEDTLAKFAAESGFTPEETAALKVATLLEISGMDKEAKEIRHFYTIPPFTQGIFLKMAAETVRDELDKVANDFMNNMLLDAMIVPNAMTNTIPGRVVDAMVISKLTKNMHGQPKQDGPDFPVSPVPAPDAPKLNQGVNA